MNKSLKGIDITTYPEGYQKIVDSLDFLPDDKDVREKFMLNFFKTIVKR